MKINTLQENLIKGILLASRFTTSKAQLPILGNILLTTNKTKLNISSTNLEISVSTNIGAKIEEEGQISIPAKVISEIVGNLPKGNIDLSTDKEQVLLKAPSFHSKVLGMDGSDFPKIPGEINKGRFVNLEKDVFTKALGKAFFATSTDETRPILTGVLIIFTKENIQVVATDGFRLSRIDIPSENLTEEKIVIPKSVLSEISRIEDLEKNILFEINNKDKQVLFGVGESVISSRIIEGDYPDFEKIIPKTSNVDILVDKEEFGRAIKLASIFAREAANVVKIKVLKDKIKVTAESSVSGSQEAEVDAKITGEEIEIAFNYKYIEDFLHSVSGEEVKMNFVDGQKAAIFTDTSDLNYLHLIMPVRVQG